MTETIPEASRPEPFIDKTADDMLDLEELLEEEREKLYDAFPLESFVKDFKHRYLNETSFRGLVHKYLDISMYKRLTLRLREVFSPQKFKEETDSLVEDYAIRAREDFIEAMDIRRREAAIQRMEEQLAKHEEEYTLSEKLKGEKKRELGEMAEQASKARSEIKQEYAARLEEEAMKAAAERNRIIIEKDTKRIVREKVAEQLKRSSLVKQDEKGQLAYDEELLVGKLEDIFLKEIIAGIEKDDGTGFLTKAKESYDGLISHWAEIDDIIEIESIDWPESIVYSASRGYDVPQFPWLIVGKKESFSRSSINTAIAVDTSTSMEQNQRFLMAKKTALATAALMRNLNTKNATYLAHFGYGLKEITPKQLVKDVGLYGHTRTDLALHWLVDTLADKGPGLAYIITDGRPEGIDQIMEKTLAAAARFKQHPYLLLRIMLIDGSDYSKDVVRKLGMAAGDDTKVLPVSNYQLGQGMIINVHESIQQMYSINDF